MSELEPLGLSNHQPLGHTVALKPLPPLGRSMASIGQTFQVLQLSSEFSNRLSQNEKSFEGIVSSSEGEVGSGQERSQSHQVPSFIPAPSVSVVQTASTQNNLAGRFPSEHLSPTRNLSAVPQPLGNPRPLEQAFEYKFPALANPETITSSPSESPTTTLQPQPEQHSSSSDRSDSGNTTVKPVDELPNNSGSSSELVSPELNEIIPEQPAGTDKSAEVALELPNSNELLKDTASKLSDGKLQRLPEIQQQSSLEEPHDASSSTSEAIATSSRSTSTQADLIQPSLELPGLTPGKSAASPLETVVSPVEEPPSEEVELSQPQRFEEALSERAELPQLQRLEEPSSEEVELSPLQRATDSRDSVSPASIPEISQPSTSSIDSTQQDLPKSSADAPDRTEFASTSEQPSEVNTDSVQSALNAENPSETGEHLTFEHPGSTENASAVPQASEDASSIDQPAEPGFPSLADANTFVPSPSAIPSPVLQPQLEQPALSDASNSSNIPVETVDELPIDQSSPLAMLSPQVEQEILSQRSEDTDRSLVGLESLNLDQHFESATSQPFYERLQRLPESSEQPVLEELNDAVPSGSDTIAASPQPISTEVNPIQAALESATFTSEEPAASTETINASLQPGVEPARNLNFTVEEPSSEEAEFSTQLQRFTDSRDSAPPAPILETSQPSISSVDSPTNSAQQSLPQNLADAPDRTISTSTPTNLSEINSNSVQAALDIGNPLVETETRSTNSPEISRLPEVAAPQQLNWVEPLDEAVSQPQTLQATTEVEPLETIEQPATMQPLIQAAPVTPSSNPPTDSFSSPLASKESQAEITAVSTDDGIPAKSTIQSSTSEVTSDDLISTHKIPSENNTVSELSSTNSPTSLSETSQPELDLETLPATQLDVESSSSSVVSSSLSSDTPQAQPSSAKPPIVSSNEVVTLQSQTAASISPKAAEPLVPTDDSTTSNPSQIESIFSHQVIQRSSNLPQSNSATSDSIIESSHEALPIVEENTTSKISNVHSYTPLPQSSPLEAERETSSGEQLDTEPSEASSLVSPNQFSDVPQLEPISTNSVSSLNEPVTIQSQIETPPISQEIAESSATSIVASISEPSQVENTSSHQVVQPKNNSTPHSTPESSRELPTVHVADATVPDSWSNLSELLSGSTSSHTEKQSSQKNTPAWESVFSSLNEVAESSSVQRSLIEPEETPEITTVEENSAPAIHLSPESAAPVTEVSAGNSTSQPDQRETPSDEQLEELAYQIYSQLRQQLEIDRERHGQFIAGHQQWMTLTPPAQSTSKTKSTTPTKYQSLINSVDVLAPLNTKLDILTEEVQQMVRWQIEIERERYGMSIGLSACY